MRCRALTLTGRVKECLNLGSYNYLGFAAADEYCTPRVLDTMSSLGWAMCSSRMDAGEATAYLCHITPSAPQSICTVAHPGLMAAPSVSCVSSPPRRRELETERVYSSPVGVS